MPSIRYREGYKYQLAEAYCVHLDDFHPPEAIRTEFISLNKTGRLIIKQGYAWDGPSGPTVDTRNFMRGSLVHDALYQLFGEGLLDVEVYRKRADEILREICREDGMSAVRAWWVYSAVRMAGCPAACAPDVILEAP
jgi:hypothetical protein